MISMTPNKSLQGTFDPALYVGEAECVRDRLRGHLGKDFWNHVVFFTSKDENLTKAHIRYLEGRLIDQARSAGRSVLVNGQSIGSKLPESDREDMEIFLEKINQLLPVLGADALLPIGSAPQGVGERQQLVCEISVRDKGAAGYRPHYTVRVRRAPRLTGRSERAGVGTQVPIYADSTSEAH